jgi:predicted permease
MMLSSLVRDARFGWRGLRKAPGFTVTAAATLAIAIGVNTAVFSVVDAMLLKPLPFPDADRLAIVASTRAADGAAIEDRAQTGATWEALRDHARLVDVAAYSTWTSGANIVAAGTVSHVRQQRVGAGLFDVLGVRPIVGRTFDADEDRPGGPAAVVLSHALWQQLYDGSPGAVGAVLELKGEHATIVGIMPPGFRTGERADIWTPLRPTTTGEGAGENYTIVARLRDGAEPAAAGAEVHAIAGEADARARPETPSAVFRLQPMQRALAADVRLPLLIVWAAVWVVLLITCVNLAGLLLARTSGRSRELATRMALGSGRGAVIRQILAESLVLAALGGILGLIAGTVLLDLARTSVPELLDLWRPVTLDGRAVVAAALFALAASALFGTVPAWHASRLDPRTALAGSRTVSTRRGWTRRALVVTQVALSVLLLVLAGLLARTFTHLRGLDPGFTSRGLITATLSLDDARYRDAAVVQRMFGETLDLLGRAPGIEAAAVSLGLPYERLLNLGFQHATGPHAGERRNTSASYVSPGFFDAMGIPLRAGRPFTSADTARSQPVAIVSEAFARQYFGGEPALGHRIGMAGGEREIVGVVGNVQVRPGWGNHGPLAAMPTAYIPISQASDGMMRLVHTWFAPAFVVRTGESPERAGAAIRRALDAADPMLPIARIRAMDTVRAESLEIQRLLLQLVGGLALTAVLLAGIGIHGLIATSVVERARETAIRLALGATNRGALRSLAAPGLTLTLIGVALGGVASLAASPVLRSLVWGVSPSDPLTLAAAGLGVVLVALVASVLPALRILRLDPAEVLRSDG